MDTSEAGIVQLITKQSDKLAGGSRDKLQVLHVHHEHVGMGAGVAGDASSYHKELSRHGSSVPSPGQNSLQSC